MKKLLLSIITGFFLLSCGGNDGWSNSDKTIFKNAIKQSVPGHISKEMANDFTDCMLEESMNKWSSLEGNNKKYIFVAPLLIRVKQTPSFGQRRHIGCFCLTRKDNQKLASTEILAACFKPSAPKPELDPRDKQQTKL